MINNKLINNLSKAYAKDNSKDYDAEQCAFIVAQSVFCWLFRTHIITIKD